MKAASVSRRLAVAAACGVSIAAFAPHVARADLCASVPTVFNGDPCDPATGPYPMLPGLPLVLPLKGPVGLWSDGSVVTTGLTGDIDLAIRVGSFPTETEIPAPAGSPGNPNLLQNTAGGGGAMQGTPIQFTTFVTDGPGIYAYGAPLAGLDERPVAVFAFADLDGDGVIGPTDTDGTADNKIESQEAIGHVGRQVGQIDGDRFRNVLAVRVGAPASIGGLRVGIVSGMYTGDDPGQLWSNGTPIFTNWPFFPPLDPLEVVFLDEANPPDPSGPNIVFYQPSEFFLPDPSEPELVDAFALQTDGSNASTDQFLSISGPAESVRLFQDVDPGNFTPSPRLIARPAPKISGLGRTLVIPAGAIAVGTDSSIELRVMPVDSLGNIADPVLPGIPVKIVADGGLQIIQPNNDGSPFYETLTIDEARGKVIKIGTAGVSGRNSLTLYDPPPSMLSGFDQALIFSTASGDVDADDDGVPDDGDSSRNIGDRPCSAADIINSVPCDDNCPNVVNPAQNDSDGDGQGNCCDGACVIDDAEAGCSECPQAASRFQTIASRARLSVKPRAGTTTDGVRLKTILPLLDGQSVDPANEEVEVTIAEGDRLHYFVQLPGAFTQTNSAPTYVYEDPTGAVGGVIRAQFHMTPHGLNARFQAKGLDLVDTAPAEDLPNGLVVAITIGDDTFTRHVKCVSSLRVVRCKSVS